MCLVLVAHDCHPRFRLIVAANRDEVYARPAERVHLWPGTSIAGGVDSEGGGTWMAVSRGGRFAAVTNYRDARELRPKEAGEPSRGGLVRGFVEGEMGAADYLAGIAAAAHRYRGFNLLAADGEGLYWLANRGGDGVRVEPGFHGLSNHLLDTPWPKVTEGLAAFREVVEGRDRLDEEALFGVLADTRVPADERLPDTGIGIERERLLGARFIRMAGYGTRCSTLLFAARDGTTTLLERTHAPEPLGDARVVLPPP